MPIIVEWLECPTCDRPISELDGEETNGLLPEQTGLVLASKVLDDSQRDLLEGAENNDIPQMERAVAAGANVSAADPDLYDSCALHYAAGQGQFEAVQWLLKRGVQVDTLNSCGESPLHWAAENGHMQVIVQTLRPSLLLLFPLSLRLCPSKSLILFSVWA